MVLRTGRRYNTSSLRAITYQHWTAASRHVAGCPDNCDVHNLVCPEEEMPACLNKTCPTIDAQAGGCNQIQVNSRPRATPLSPGCVLTPGRRWQFTEPLYPYTGDGCGSAPSWTWPHNQSEVDAGKSQDGRYYLQNAPEFLRPESGTFFADGETIFYAPFARELGAFSAGTASVVAARPGLRTLLRGGQSECFPHIGPEYTDDQIFRCGRNASNTMRARDLVLVSHFRCLPRSCARPPRVTSRSPGLRVLTLHRMFVLSSTLMRESKLVWSGAHRHG